MTIKEEVKIGNRTVAVVIRKRFINNGLKFFTSPENPIQVATHKYKLTKKTRVHKSDIRKSVRITELHKFLFITKGSALVYIINGDQTVTTKRLHEGDGIIIMSVNHKVHFDKHSSAVEIKQGPYEPDT